MRKKDFYYAWNFPIRFTEFPTPPGERATFNVVGDPPRTEPIRDGFSLRRFFYFSTGRCPSSVEIFVLYLIDKELNLILISNIFLKIGVTVFTQLLGDQ